MKSAIKTRWIKLAIICGSTFFSIANAESPSLDIDSQINSNKWKEATRAIFLEARDAYSYEPSIPIGLAKIGYLGDALDTITSTAPNDWSYGFMSLVQNVPSISQKDKDNLLKKSLDAARQETGVAAEYLKSGSLTRIALFYASQGDESTSKSIFNEALVDAEKGLKEEGSGAYRKITDVMVNAPDGIPNWMIQRLGANLEKSPDPNDIAFACKDIATALDRLKEKEQAAAFIEHGIVAANSIVNVTKKKLALLSLAETAQEMDYRASIRSNRAPDVAIREATLGNAKQAYAIVSTLGDNTYVNFKLSTYEKIVSGAVKRGDLKTALYFAERPVEKLEFSEINVWRQIAEKQMQQGDHQAATVSYRRAVAVFDSYKTGEPRYLFDIQASVLLGQSMLKNGMSTEGQQTIERTQTMITAISDKLKADRITAAILISDALWHAGKRVEAKELLLNAYRASHSFDTNALFGKMNKSHLLSQIALTTSLFFLSPQ